MSVRMEGALLTQKGKEMRHEQVIYGTPPSKSNQYRVVTVNGHGSLAKTAAMKKYERDFFMQCSEYRGRRIKGYFELILDVYLPTQRQDLDNILKGVLDCLQSCGAIDNDRWCVRIEASKYVDPVRPRVEFTIREVGGIETHASRQPGLFDGEG